MAAAFGLLHIGHSFRDLPLGSGDKSGDTAKVDMVQTRQLYIDGQWVASSSDKTIEVINPATEAVIGSIAAGSASDVDRAVAAARKAFATFSVTSVEDRRALLHEQALPLCGASRQRRLWCRVSFPPLHRQTR